LVYAGTARQWAVEKPHSHDRAMAQKAIQGVWTHGQTSLTVPPFVVNVNFFNNPSDTVFQAM